MTDTKYNGWTNYETWNVNLWLDNDAASFEHWHERSNEVYADAVPDEIFSKRERATLDLADQIKDYIEEINPLGDEASCFSDLLGAAISSVNWYEIASHWIDYAEDSQAA